ncbi:hypothetical protein B7494_g2275 [Chlorociboria aeruginascens]|nr:hypothetical protein B7494_g2275 [Chlorociboria aeruginascens]
MRDSFSTRTIIIHIDEFTSAVAAAGEVRGSYTTLSFLVPCIQRRTFGWDSFGWKSKKPAVPKNSLTEEHLKRKPAPPPTLVRGSLSKSSIFEDEEIAGEQPKVTVDKAGNRLTRNPESMAAALDPDPVNRRRWERKMVIRGIHKRGRLSKTQMLKRQERQLLSKSHDFKTSVKKLVPLAKQICGKTIDEAITQMRFSKKKAAADVKAHLEHARNEAIVKRGMGLGAGKVGGQDIKVEVMKIMTKDKRRVTVQDPTTIYIDQAWCGKGAYGRTPDYRARGRLFFMKNPTTSLTVMLKEEATRIRLHKEREEKIKNRKVWIQLPNRPVTAQRQFYSW